MIESVEREDLSPLKRAILEMRELRSRLDQSERRHREPIALVGMGLRFPGGVDTPDAFWHLLRDGVDAISEIPAARWNVEAYYDPNADAPGKMYTRHGGFVTGVDQFAPSFFGIAPREAATMDPQQRLLLEVTWEALERAGQAPEQLKRSKTGIFLGICSSDYAHMLRTDEQNLDVYFATGTAPSVAAGRLSYVLGLNGPSLAIDTACSSSLTAVHLACQSLRSGESDLAVAGGVNLILSPEINVAFSKAQMMARDGHCKTFDAAADGYVRSEGCAVVVLKRLTDAHSDGNPILAIIRGSAVNQDGRSSGLTAPNGPAQEAVIRTALANAGVAPHEVGYVETHGTGTSLGDPIEVRALGATLGVGRRSERPLLIGSVKANIGHLEAAAGVAGLIKVVLALRHGAIPPQVNLETLNPGIPWQTLPLAVPTTLTPWPAGQEPRIAGVSSFGFSGTNAHVILQAAPPELPVAEAVDRPLHVLSLSARTAAELETLGGRYADYFADERPDPAADVCFTANAGRDHFEHRLAIVGATPDQLHLRLAAAMRGEEPVGVARGTLNDATECEVGFLFTGQGALYPGAGQALLESQPIFRAAIERCDLLLLPHLGRSIQEALYPDLHPSPDGATLLGQMRFAQPALLTLQFALGELWRSWGIVPGLVMGHSAGEYAAACLAGILSLEDALALVVSRGRLLQSLPGGGEMMAVMADETRVAAAIEPYAELVSIAAINGPQSVVVSGETAAVRSIQADLAAQGLECRRLDISTASHSPLVEPMLDEFEHVARGVRYRSPEIALVSSVSGEMAGPELQTANYWRAHMRQPVRFAAGMRTLYAQGCRVFVELGPHPTLIGMGRDCVPEDSVSWLPSLRQGRDDWEQILESLSGLYVAGVAVDWLGCDRPYPRRRVELPTYPWQRQRCWLEVQPPPARHASSSEERWAALESAAERQSAQAPLDLTLSSYPAKWDCLNRLASVYMARALRGLALFTRPDEARTFDELLRASSILQTYHHLVRRWLDHLVSDGFLELRPGNIFVSPVPLPTEVPAGLEQEARATLADVPELLEYVVRCGEKLGAVLCGAESPLETLFPGGSYATVEYLYDRWAVARYFNAIVRAVVESLVASQPAGAPLRLVEIGAGTGGTSASLLPVLPPGRTTYDFTDVSDFFLARAQERFQQYPFVRYRVLDVEQDPLTQGFEPHSHDLVVAANVLHATTNLDQTLRHARSLLAPGGILVMYEATEHLLWLDVTTGLIAGWQRFDDAWRVDQPLLAAEQWTAALRANGFGAVQAFPSAGSPASILGQHVVIAQAPGLSASAHEPRAAVSPTTGTYGSVDRGPAAPPPIARLIEDALPTDRRELLVAHVRKAVAVVLRTETPELLGREHPLLDLGLDSLMAVELRNRLTTSLGLSRKLPATLVFDHPTIAAIASYIETAHFAQNGRAAETATQTRTKDRNQPRENVGSTVSAAQLAELSDEEVARLLIHKLGSHG